MSRKRDLTPYIVDDLKNRMVFIGGPRQVGKTTLALSLLPPKEISQRYLSWDKTEHQRLIIQEKLPIINGRMVLDEIHKYHRWRNFLKGYFDVHKKNLRLIVTGSARLDYFRKGGDSLFGRYHYYRLHPFSVEEFDSQPSHSTVEHLMRCGGFPEPALRASESFLRRWQRERIAHVVQQDLRDLTRISEITKIESLLEALPDRIGSPLSVNSLREDLDCSHGALVTWLKATDNMYLTFRISPYGAPKVRAVKKEQKLYFWDWAMAPNGGSRFENFVASHLLKFCHFIEDTEGYSMELRFLRDTDRREIDFVVLKDRQPLFAVEAKSGERSCSPHIGYFKERTKIPAYYQVHLGHKEFRDVKTGTHVLPFYKFATYLKNSGALLNKK